MNYFAYNRILLGLETQLGVPSGPGTAAFKACFLDKFLSWSCGRWEGLKHGLCVRLQRFIFTHASRSEESIDLPFSRSKIPFSGDMSYLRRHLFKVGLSLQSAFFGSVNPETELEFDYGTPLRKQAGWGLTSESNHPIARTGTDGGMEGEKLSPFMSGISTWKKKIISCGLKWTFS